MIIETSSSTPPNFSFDLTSLILNSVGTTTVGVSGQSLGSSLATCNPVLFSTFDILKCMAGLFFLDTDQVSSLSNNLSNTLLHRFPVGYITRLVNILSGSATTTLPDIVLHMPASSPIGAGTSTLFSMDDGLNGAQAILATVAVSDSGGSIWSILDPVLTMLLTLILAMMVFHDITGVHKHSKR